MDFSATGIGFQKKFNPTTGLNGFSEGQFEIYQADFILANDSSSIFVPEEAVLLSKGIEAALLTVATFESCLFKSF